MFPCILASCSEFYRFTFKFPSGDVILILLRIGPCCFSLVSIWSSHVMVKLQIKTEASGHVHC